MWNPEPVFDATHRAVLSAGKPLVYVCPPAGWVVAPLVEQLPREGLSVIAVPETADVADVTRTAAPRRPGYTHALTGIDRTARLLGRNQIATLVGTPDDLAELVRRSVLKMDQVAGIVVAWPELHPTRSGLDELLAEAPAAQRLIATGKPAAVEEFTQRHAHRAPVVPFAPEPGVPVGQVDYALAGPSRRADAVTAVLDQLRPDGPVAVWDPSGVVRTQWTPPEPGVVFVPPDDLPSNGTVILADLPTAGVMSMLSADHRAVAIVRPTQLEALAGVARVSRPVRISAEHDRARNRVLELRKQVRALAERRDYGLELAAIDPLLDEFDPAQLAAAALHGFAVPPDSPAAATWTRIHVNAGHKDHVKAGDLVGLLVNVVGIRRGEIGRIDIRESFALVEVRPGDADGAVRGLTGQTVRGKRIAARLDRK